MNPILRRQFFKSIGGGVLSLAHMGNPRFSPITQRFGTTVNEELKIQKYNRLGNTELQISDIGFGAINYFNPNVLRYAYDLGINYFDTAESYMRAMSETYIGQALKDVRRRVVLATKHGIASARDLEQNALIKRVEDSLKRLQTDYIDIALIHQVSDVELLENSEVLSAYDRLKKDGKIRLTGFSTHSPEKMLRRLLRTDFWDVILFIYNHIEGPSLDPLLREVRAKGIGTVAMKALAGNKQGNLAGMVDEQTKYFQAALRWVLSNPDIDSCIITMNTFSHVEGYIAASGKSLDRISLESISKYQNLAGNLYCRLSCTACLPACPHGIAINDVLRCSMYFEDYRLERHALELYDELGPSHEPLPCTKCSAPCEQACPFGISIQERMIHAHYLLRP